MKPELKQFTLSLLNIRSWYDVLFNLTVSAIAGLFTYVKLFYIDNKSIFIMITMVVLGDFVFGCLANLKNFQTKKALKVVWYFTCYNYLAYLVLLIEAAHPAAFWLSEAVIMPIMAFQIVSILKNMKKLNMIPAGVVSTILDKIDKHKDTSNEGQ